MRIDALDIEEHILEKIETKHGVRFDEVREVSLSEQLDSDTVEQDSTNFSAEPRQDDIYWSSWQMEERACGGLSRLAT